MVCVAALATSCQEEPDRRNTYGSPRPNIIFILTDDQDTASLEEMPSVRGRLIGEGATFGNAIFTFPQCCPSRASILRGQYPHNHEVLDNVPPLGGETVFRDRGLAKSTVATWLDASGYETALVGKYLNNYDDLEVPPGWDEWYGQLGKGAEHEELNENGRRVSHADEHMDTVLSERALDLLSEKLPKSDPFFLWASFNAPHEPADPAPRDMDGFSEATVPRTPGFNEEDVSDKPAWVREYPPLSRDQVTALDARYRDRLRSLQTVDRFVRRATSEVREAGELENTYFVFWTDNGYHMGEHRLPPAKHTPYVEDVRFPLIVTGPGIERSTFPEKLVANTDLAPTFAEMAGADAPGFVDGRSLLPLLETENPSWREAALVDVVASKKTLYRPGHPAYQEILTQRYAYTEYENGERELYDLDKDPYQLDNVADSADRALVEGLGDRLDALKGCAGGECREAEDVPAP